MQFILQRIAKVNILEVKMQHMIFKEGAFEVCCGRPQCRVVKPMQLFDKSISC